MIHCLAKSRLFLSDKVDATVGGTVASTTLDISQLVRFEFGFLANSQCFGYWHNNYRPAFKIPPYVWRTPSRTGIVRQEVDQIYYEDWDFIVDSSMYTRFPDIGPNGERRHPYWYYGPQLNPPIYEVNTKFNYTERSDLKRMAGLNWPSQVNMFWEEGTFSGAAINSPGDPKSIKVHESENQYIGQYIITNHLLLLMQWLEDTADQLEVAPPVWRRFEDASSPAVSYSTTPDETDLGFRLYHYTYYFKDIYLWIMQNIPQWGLNFAHLINDFETKYILQKKPNWYSPGTFWVPSTVEYLQYVVPQEQTCETGFNLTNYQKLVDHGAYPKNFYYAMFPLNMSKAAGPPIVTTGKSIVYSAGGAGFKEKEVWFTLSKNINGGYGKVKFDMSGYMCVEDATAAGIQQAINYVTSRVQIGSQIGIPCTVSVSSDYVGNGPTGIGTEVTICKAVFSDNTLTRRDFNGYGNTLNQIGGYTTPSRVSEVGNPTNYATASVAGWGLVSFNNPAAVPTQMTFDIIYKHAQDLTDPTKGLRIVVSNDTVGTADDIFTLKDKNMPNDIFTAIQTAAASGLTGSSVAVVSDNIGNDGYRRIAIRVTASDIYYKKQVGGLWYMTPKMQVIELNGSWIGPTNGVDGEHLPNNVKYSDIFNNSSVGGGGGSAGWTVQARFTDDVQRIFGANNFPLRYNCRKTASYTATKIESTYYLPLFGQSLKTYFGIHEKGTLAKMLWSWGVVSDYYNRDLSGNYYASRQVDLPITISLYYGFVYDNFIMPDAFNPYTIHDTCYAAADAKLATFSITDTNPGVPAMPPTTSYRYPLPTNSTLYRLEKEFDFPETIFTTKAKYLVFALKVPNIPQSLGVTPDINESDTVYNLDNYLGTDYRNTDFSWIGKYYLGNQFYCLNYSDYDNDYILELQSLFGDEVLQWVLVNPLPVPTNPQFPPPYYPNNWLMSRTANASPESAAGAYGKQDFEVNKITQGALMDVKLTSRPYNTFSNTYIYNNRIAHQIRRPVTFIEDEDKDGDGIPDEDQD